MLGLAYERPRPWRDRATLDPTYVATGGVSACQSRRRRATSSTEARFRIERISLAPRQRMHEILARDQLDPSLESEDRRIAHSPMIVNGAERELAVDEQHGEKVLHVHVRHRCVVDRTRGTGRQMNDDRLDAARRDAVVLH